MQHRHLHSCGDRAPLSTEVAAGRPRLIPRIPRIQELCRGRRVLDVGCCNHCNFEQLDSGGFLHAEIHKVAKELVGFDNDPEGIAEMNLHGFTIVQGDAQNLASANLAPFEVIVAGELIEHLSNPGLFLDGAWELLKPGGRLVATLPNAWAFSRIKQLYKGLDDLLWTHPQHTCWYSKATVIELFRRHRYQVAEIAFCDMRTSDRWLKRMRDWLRLWWARKPEFAESVFIVGQKPSAGS